MSDPVASTVSPAARGARSSRRAARGQGEVPRVARDPPQLGVGERRAGELRRGRARVHHRAGLEHAVDDRVGDLGDDALLEERALLEGAPGDRLLLLEQERDPLERSDVLTPAYRARTRARRRRPPRAAAR